MARSLPKDQAVKPPAIDPEEAWDLQDRDLDGGGKAGEEDTSPQAFYRRSVEREDVREILERLAKG